MSCELFQSAKQFFNFTVTKNSIQIKPTLDEVPQWLVFLATTGFSPGGSHSPPLNCGMLMWIRKRPPRKVLEHIFSLSLFFLLSIAGGELFERIVDDNFEHTELTSVHYMQQILEGVTYMHQQSILHLDLKPENIVCVDTTGTSIKIIDFGLATKIGTQRVNFSSGHFVLHCCCIASHQVNVFRRRSVQYIQQQCDSGPHNMSCANIRARMLFVCNVALPVYTSIA